MPRNRRSYGVVNCDATHNPATDVAFVAITGALGAHARRVECPTSTHAEALAVLFAMELAEAQPGHPARLIFRTDARAVSIGVQPGVRANRDRQLGSLFVRVRRMLEHRRQFELQHVSRRKVIASHTLARLARDAHKNGTPWPVAGEADALWEPEFESPGHLAGSPFGV